MDNHSLFCYGNLCDVKMKDEDFDFDIKEALGKYNDWVKKNWFTLVGIIIILLITWYDVATCQVRVKTEVDRCIEFYENEFKKINPTAIYDSPTIPNISINWSNNSND